MYQPESRHKVVTKNLEDIIKESTFSTKRNSVDEMIKCQRHLNTEPKIKNNSSQIQRLNTNANIDENEINDGRFKNGFSISKHSIESKEKINFLNLSKVSIKTKINSYDGQSGKEKYNRSKNYNLKQNQQTFNEVNSHHHQQSLYFNQVDAIFTELQDFLRETRQTVLNKMETQNQSVSQSSHQMVNQMDELFIVFKQELQRLVQKFPQNTTKIKNKIIGHRQQFGKSPKKKVTQGQNYQNRCYSSKQNQIDNKNLKSNILSKNQLSKYGFLIQDQNMNDSKIFCGNNNQQDNQFSSQMQKQTSSEMLSILVLKNKLNNTKRKYQNSNNNSVLNTKYSSPVKQNSQGEYSFRNKFLFDDTSQILNKNYQQTTDKKKNIKQSKSQNKNKQSLSHTGNKQNRQKSIYEIVLEQNRRLKTSVNK